MQVDIALDQSDNSAIEAMVLKLAAIESPLSAKGISEILAKAGAREVLDQVNGKVTPSTVAEWRAHRICLLLLNGLTVRDAEIVITAMYRVPLASARRYIDAAFARYDIELEDIVVKAVRDVLENAEKVELKWEVVMPCDAVRQWLVDKIYTGNQERSRRAERAEAWSFTHDAYNYLRTLVGLSRVKP